MTETHTAQLFNLSSLIFVGSIVPFTLFLIYVILNSPVATPILRIWAEQAFKNKNYRRAAPLYKKLDFFQAQLEGDIYLKKSALAYELAGSIQEALEAYRKAQEWPKVGQLLTELGKIEQAKEVYLENGLFQRLALLYEQEKNYLAAGKIYADQLQARHKAELALRRALDDSNPEVFLEARLLLVLLYVHMERFDEAQEQFQAANAVLESSVQYQEFPILIRLRDKAQFMLQNRQPKGPDLPQT